MKRVLLSVGSLALVAGATFMATSAFFSDTEKSTGNTFTAGKVDLKVDSTSHYAGMVCSLVGESYVWVDEDQTLANNPRPELLNTACTGTWLSKDLVQEKFFNFTDVKPGDEGENTISLTVDNNPSWACMRIDNMTNDENQIIDPETEAGDADLTGELSDNLHFTSWLDDGITPGWQCPMGQAACTADPMEGDNKWYTDLNSERQELILFTNESGPASDVLGGKTYALAAPTGAASPLPLAGNVTNYIGLQWCAGTMVVDQDLGTITCNGASMGNDVQTDSLTADMKFYVEQSRNNAQFSCDNVAWNN